MSSRHRNQRNLHDDPQYDDTSTYSPDPWHAPYGDVEPSDSASASGDYEDRQPRRNSLSRNASRRHSRSARQQQAYNNYGIVPAQAQSPNMSSDPSEDYYGASRGAYAPSAHPHYGYHSQGQGQAGYPYGGGGGVAGGAAGAGRQLVHYPQNGYTGNPFMANPPPAQYYGDQTRQSYEMVPSHHVPYQQNYYSTANNQYALPMQPYMYNAPPPPPTEAPAKPQTPAPPPEKKVDPELELMKQKLEMFEREKMIQREAEERKAVHEAALKAAEIDLQRRVEADRKAKDEAEKELAKHKLEAERAARERIEAERKAKEEEARQQKLAIERIEAETRLKYEREQIELAEKRQRQEELEKAAAEALKAKVEAAEAAARAKAAAEFKAEIEAQAAAEKKVQEEMAWRKKLEEEAKLKAEVEARAKLEEERQKAEEARIAAEEKKKAEKAMRDKIVEETKAKIQDDAKKNEKPPIKFKDAVGRKFSFPFNLCQTWTGMEELIKQAFVQVEAIGPHVQEGHYDLVGPNGEIILPSIWEKVVEPDWAITMHMWPMDKTPPLKNAPPNAQHPMFMPNGQRPMPGVAAGRGMPIPMRGVPNGVPRPGYPMQVPVGARPGSAGPRMPSMHPVPGMHGMPGMPVMDGMGVPNIQVVDGDHRHHSSHEKKKGSSSKAAGTTFLAFMGGKPPKAKKRK